jgi:hypothetical protein
MARRHKSIRKKARGISDGSNIYRVYLQVEPAVILGEPKTASMAQGEILFCDILDPTTQKPKAIGIVATLPAINIDAAISHARGLANRILSLFSYLTNTSLPDLLIMKAYDVTPGKKKGDFVQSFYDIPMERHSTRVVNKGSLSKCVTAISALPESDNSSIFRAMHWYRLALQSTDMMERYTSLWIGLETINPLLRQHYGLEIEYSQCKCGRKKAPTLNGVRELMNELEEGGSLWREKTGLRAGVIHGYRAFKEITPEVRIMVPVLEQALEKGLNLILGLDKLERSKPANLANPQVAYYHSRGIISGPDMKDVDKEFEPTIIYELKLFKGAQNAPHHEIKFGQKIEDDFSFSNLEHALLVQSQVADNVSFKIVEPQS